MKTLRGVRRIGRERYLGLLAAIAIVPALTADPREDGERGIEAYRKGNLIESLELLQKSAVSGYAPAQTTLAFILDAAEADEEAVRWYREAAASNDPAGLFGLGGMIAKGEGIRKDPERAGQLIEQAARLGHVPAMRAYAHALEQGQLGFESRQEAAAEWYLQAARRNDATSIRRLEQAYTLGQLGLSIDLEAARAWKQKLDANEQVTQ